MFKRKLLSFLFLIIFLANSLFFASISKPTYSAGASLFLSPSSGTKYVGDKFNVLVYVGTDQAANTFDVNLSVSNLTVTGISIGGSICILHPSPPSFNNLSGRFRCGLPTPGYTGSGGYIGSISVKGNAPGTAKVFVDANSQVLANDGAGTNILASRGTATFNIQPQPTSAPAISSSTHPDQDKWYKEKNPQASWSGSGNQFSWQVDQNPDSAADQTSEGTATTTTLNNLSDGIWYLHVRVRGSNGTWSETAHYRFQIDTTPPNKFTPEADPKNNAEKRPIIAFNTTDATSGIDHYELKMDEGKWEVVNNPFRLSKVTSGTHTIFVKAVDKAGNETIGSVEITVKDITPPIITFPEDGSFISYGNDLIIKGKSFPEYRVRIFLDGKEIATVKADKNGDFEFTYKELLRNGKHELYALAINPDDIESPPSKKVYFTMDPQAVKLFGQTIPSITILISLFILIFIFLFLIVWLILGAKRFRRKFKSVMEKLEEKVEIDLTEEKVSRKTKEKIEEDFEEAEDEIENK